MTLVELATLVKAVRGLQSKFFRTHDRAVLVESKRLEAQLDRAVEDIVNPSLFGVETEASNGS